MRQIRLLAGATALGMALLAGTWAANAADSPRWKDSFPFAESGNALAQCQLGELILRGVDAHRPKKEAANWFSRAAQQNALCGLLRMGDLNRWGIGLKKDKAKANDFYARALPLVEARATSGEIEMMIQAGKMYQRGWGVEQSRPNAGRWYQTAVLHLEPLVRAGDVNAHKKLGTLLIIGVGVKRDVVRARELYEAAATSGDRAAQFLAGFMWFKGRAGHAVDHARGFNWLFLAAEQDHPRSQFLVGEAYGGGLGTDRNIRKAAMWLTLADQRGVGEAEGALSVLKDIGMDADYAAGVADAEGWKPVFDREVAS